MKTVEGIVNDWRARQLARGEFFERCRLISQHYNNQIVLPLPEVDSTEKPAVANLLAQGVDQHAMRVSSVLPDVQCPPVKPGDKASERRADQRRRASLGFWQINRYDLLMRRRARWLAAFAEAPVRLYPSKTDQGPRWMLHTPLETYPSKMRDGQLQPDDCVIATTHTVAWVRDNYPDFPIDTIRMPGGYQGDRGLQPGDDVQIVQWLDANETVTVLCGPGEQTGLTREAEYGINGARILNLTPPGYDNPAKQWGVEIGRTPNRLGETPIVVPGRITLDVPKGQFDDMPGLASMQAKLAAMEINAIANGIWPDQWIVGAEGRNPQIITAADGRRGIVGEIKDGQIVTTQMQAGVQTPMALDRLERAQRLNGGIPSDFSGESATNIRTARRGGDVLSAAVDYTIQEHQQVLAASAQIELAIASNIDLTYFRSKKKSFYIDWKHGKGRLDYTPAAIWTEDRTVRVGYAKAGADINMLNVQIGQLSSLGILSKLTAARMHPDVMDPQYEMDQVQYEQLRDGLVAQLPGQLQQGSLAVTDYVRVMELVRQDKVSIEEAVAQAQQEAQARQATQVAPAAPEGQPGLNDPAAGGQATIGPPGPSMENLTSILRNLRTQNQVAQA